MSEMPAGAEACEKETESEETKRAKKNRAKYRQSQLRLSVKPSGRWREDQRRRDKKITGAPISRLKSINALLVQN
jgi:hypothetical protein